MKDKKHRCISRYRSRWTKHTTLPHDGKHCLNDALELVVCVCVCACTCGGKGAYAHTHACVRASVRACKRLCVFVTSSGTSTLHIAPSPMSTSVTSSSASPATSGHVIVLYPVYRCHSLPGQKLEQGPVKGHHHVQPQPAPRCRALHSVHDPIQRQPGPPARAQQPVR